MKPRRLLSLLAIATILIGCTHLSTPTATPQPPNSINLDDDTQRLIDGAQRVAFLIPFSHWDTNWHDTFDSYSVQADRNILTAMEIAQQHPRFRYSLEQVYFVQHFWEHYPEQHEALRALVQSRQFTFAWGGLTQQDTSLTAPTVQWKNWQLGEQWVKETFGIESHTAWQADSFGNSAALPIMLNAQGLSTLFIGRIANICEQRPCDNPLPHAFRWQAPADPAHSVLTIYMTYSAAWQAWSSKSTEVDQRQALRDVIDREAARTTSKYLFIPFGDDRANQPTTLPDFVDHWNAADHDTILVQADPETAFNYLATQPLPAIVSDRNPLWQGYYGSRPDGKVADKESEYFLTAADKFGIPLGESPPATWNLAAFNTAHDGIAGTPYDSVWQQSQLPSFTEAVTEGTNALISRVSRIASGVNAPVVIFNPTSWERSEVVELQGDLPDLSTLPAPVQTLGPNHVAFKVEAIPAIGWRGLSGGTATIAHPTAATQSGAQVTLANGLVNLTIDGDHGGTLSSLRADGGPELLSGPGDDLVYLADQGDVYGASFGDERARQAQAPAQITILATGPLVSRVEIATTLGGVPITKTITLKADSPLVEVTVLLTALPDSTALVQTPTTLATTSRTDDLGFADFTHPLDNRPITPGTITYRRVVFYPTVGWSDVSADGAGLTLVTHGLQGLAGTDTLSLMLVREVSDGGKPDSEGVTDAGPHLLRYAYLPHSGTAADTQSWLASYAFNQPLIVTWHANNRLQVQVPFAETATPRSFPLASTSGTFPTTVSLLAATGGIIADAACRNGRLETLIIDYTPATPPIVIYNNTRTPLPATAITQQTITPQGNTCRASP